MYLTPNNGGKDLLFARKYQVYAVLLLLWSTWIIFYSQAKAHEPVKIGNPSCIHLPYEKYM